LCFIASTKSKDDGVSFNELAARRVKAETCVARRRIHREISVSGQSQLASVRFLSSAGIGLTFVSEGIEMICV